MKITITEEGLIKTDTDGISQPNHASAEGFLRQIITLAGGVAKRVLKPGAKAHTHTHGGITHTH